MLPLGLDAAELKAFNAALVSHHTVTTRVEILDMDGKPSGTVLPTVNTGQVNVTASGESTRSVTLTFLDPDHALQFDGDSPSDGALYFDRLVRVTQRYTAPTLAEPVDVPVFYGPLVKLDRTGDEVSLEGQGLEYLARGGVAPMTVKRGTNSITAIRRIMREKAGETRFDFPRTQRRLNKDVSVNWSVSPWKACRKIARSLGMQLFYDGAGTLRMRRDPKSPVFTFDEKVNVTSEVQVSHDRSQLRNRVRVVGDKPKHSATVVAPKGHPLYHSRLGRGAPFYMSEEIEESTITSKSAARDLAQARLNGFLRLSMGVTFNAVPVPHLDPLDVCLIRGRGFSAEFVLREFSLPLGTSGDMTVGYTAPVSLRRRVRRP